MQNTVRTLTLTFGTTSLSENPSQVSDSVKHSALPDFKSMPLKCFHFIKRFDKIREKLLEVQLACFHKLFSTEGDSLRQ